MGQSAVPIVHLRDFVDVAEPEAVLAEVRTTADMIRPGADLGLFERAFADVVSLFGGGYPGYKASNTRYHDLSHTLDVLLATARLLHGAAADNMPVDVRSLRVGLLGALFHDVGLIQTEDDKYGTGAKYTLGHERRSVGFMAHYFAAHPVAAGEIEDIGLVIDGTRLGEAFEKLPFPGEGVRLAAEAVAAADLLAQMADRAYLEKILLLFLEFQEAGIPYESMFDLLRKTHGFYAMAQKRQDETLRGMAGHMRAHFAARWRMDRDLYAESIRRNMDYLDTVVAAGPEGFAGRLKRNGIVESLAAKGALQS